MDRSKQRQQPAGEPRRDPPKRDSMIASSQTEKPRRKRDLKSLSREQLSDRQPFDWSLITTPTDPDMLNTISLSSDRTTAFLISNGNVHEFDLKSREGLIIGLLGNQLSIVRAVSKDDAVFSDPGEVEGDIPPPDTTPAGVLSLPFDKSSTFNIQFNAALGALSIIGATDMISTRIPRGNKNDFSGNCSLNIFNLYEKNIRIQVVKNKLLIWEQDR